MVCVVVVGGGVLRVLTLSLSFFGYMYELLGLRESFKVKGKNANTGI